MNGDLEEDDPIIYQIRVQGRLDEHWSDWFDGLTLTLESEEPPITRLTSPVPDQARLRGILCRLFDLNLTLISVERVEGGQ